MVFEGTHKDIDARKLSGAVRNVRLRLMAMKEDAFPLFSFISKGLRSGVIRNQELRS
ncbi:MAG: hypothetical protein IOC86_02185 [Aestuariivirga sp.]|nr:hypothetical protein [Aestuariivirga sp.]